MSNLPKYFYFRVKTTRKGTAIEVEDASDCDVVEVVRCKDCAKREYCRTTNVWATVPDDDWFCADAERRTDNANIDT